MSPDEFISLICHDLRAPLRGLKTLPDWAREEVQHAIGDVPGELADVFDMMRTQAHRLDRLVTDLFAFATLERVEHAPKTPIHDALPSDLSRHFEIELAVDSVAIERAHLATVLFSLMDNAIKHGNAAEAPGRVTATLVDGHVEIHVMDHGPGIDQKFHDLVLEPLRLLRSRDITEGSGMGLATVARIAELYDGTFRIRTNEDGGVSAKFRCPEDTTSSAANLG